ncbi:MAG: hypothetical protein V2A54_04635, partial [Bacteroidota bacterium]
LRLFCKNSYLCNEEFRLMKKKILFISLITIAAAIISCQNCPNPDSNYSITNLKIIPYELKTVGTYSEYVAVDSLFDGVNFLIEPVTEDVAMNAAPSFQLFPSAMAACATEGNCENQINPDSSSIIFDRDLFFNPLSYPAYADDTIFAGTNLLKDPRINIATDVSPFPTKFRKGKYEVKIDHHNIIFPTQRYNVTFRFVTTKKTVLLETVSVFICVN